MFYCPSEDRLRRARHAAPLAQARATRLRDPLDLLFRRSRRAWPGGTGGAPAGDGARKPGRAFGRQPRASDGCRSASRWAWTTIVLVLQGLQGAAGKP
ncbi:MAG: hypothetical protein ACLTMP_09360 [Eggerthella lenta]